jgi:hypothetical protein
MDSVNWNDQLLFAAIGLIILLTLYMCIHMLYNWFSGKDELDNVFNFLRWPMKKR